MMDFNVVQWLGENVAKVLPFRTIYSYERGVRWTMGKNPKELKPGLRWCLYFFHRVEQFAVVEQIINLPTQSVVTADGRAVCFSANISIVIDDAVKHYCDVQNFEQSVRDLAMGHLFERVSQQRMEDLVKRETTKRLESSLEGTLTTRLRDWGTRVVGVNFTDFVPVRNQFRLFQDQPTTKVL